MKYKFLDSKIVLVKDNVLVAYLKYNEIGDNVIDIVSVFVDSSLRGMKIASRLMEKICNYARENNKKIKPTCSYAKYWLENKKSNKDILV